MKAHISSGCIGCGLCESACPEVFRMTKNGLAEVYAQLTADTAGKAREAAESCPVTVIKIEES